MSGYALSARTFSGLAFAGGRPWIDAVVGSIQGFEGNSIPWHVTQSIGVVPRLLALLMHDSLEDYSFYARNVRRLQARFDGHQLLDALNLVGTSERRRDLERSLHALTGFRPQLRRAGASISSWNAHSNGFVPPLADRLPVLIEEVLRLRGLHERGGVQSIVLYAVFLTIHPFIDGNGRSARVMLASDLMRTVENAARLLEVACLHANSGEQFHLAAKCLRMGDASMLAEVSESLSRSAFSRFDFLVAELDQALLAEDDARTWQVMEELHAKLKLEVRRRGARE